MAVETITEKWAAINAISLVYVTMPSMGLFVATCREMVRIDNGKTLRSTAGRSSTPDMAVAALFDDLTVLKEDEHVTVGNVDADQRRNLLWNGFMWEDWKP